ncbi:MAG: SufS family cysteine desulfurase [Bacteroidales bacterium]|nr:SufS family cysteine desulfurase [Bacteroidales bacterium]
MKPEEIRSQFPALGQTVYGKPLVYLDNAATAQRPWAVLDKERQLASTVNGNIHRAVHKLAVDATEEYEKTRDAVRDFLNAGSREEIVFTSGTTMSINLVASCFGEAFIGEGDEVIVSVAEHHSNIVPWQLLCQRKKATLKVLDVDEFGGLQVDTLEKLISQRTKIVAISHISNVLGLVNPVSEIIQIAHAHDIPVLVDGAQGSIHEKVDVKAMDCDFYAFSGHKVYGATGTGVLYGKKKWLDAMPPYMGGGEMIETVRFSRTTFAPVPGKFEAGTQNFNAVPTLQEALQLARRFQEDVEVAQNEYAITQFLLDTLTADSRIHLVGVPRGTQVKVPLFSFTVEGAHHEDIALILDKMGIAVRSGQMCAEPLMDRFGVTGMLRVSFAPYNTMEEAEYFVKCLNKAIAMLV